MSTWEKEAMSHKSSHSWVSDVLRSEYGKNYLETIQTWFNKYPKASEHLKNLLESFVTEDHLGGANELFWWELMKKFQWKAHSIPENSERRPDFHITVPLEFFCEVTTLNISNKDRVALRSESGAELNYEATIFRVLRKATEEKKAQIDYSFKQGYPGILVLFDYTTWSGKTMKKLRLFVKIAILSNQKQIKQHF